MERTENGGELASQFTPATLEEPAPAPKTNAPGKSTSSAILPRL